MGDGADKKPGNEVDLPDFIDDDDVEEEETEAIETLAGGDIVPEDEEEDPEPATHQKKKRKRKSSAAGSGGDAATRRSAPPSAALGGAAVDDDAFVIVKPHSEGLFEAVAPPAEDIDSYDFDSNFGNTNKRSLIALAIIAVVAVVTVAVVFLVASDEEQVNEMRAFVGGQIVEHKTAEVKKLKARWRDEDRKSQNKYGDVTLTYFPQDLQVEVTKVTYHQSGGAWRKNLADRKEVGREPIPNDTAKLKEGQTIERLPLLNLPIFESEKVAQADLANAGAGCDPACKDPFPHCIGGQCVQVGSVKDVYYYDYVLKFSREGYHPIEKKLTPDNWTRVGPGNQIIEWQGLDLVPKPETVMANFAKAMGEIFCLMKLKEIPTLQEASAHENFEMLLIRNRFKTKEDFEAARTVLTGGEHAEWWKARQEEIGKQECTPEVP